MSDVDDFVAALRSVREPIVLQMTLDQAVTLIANIQLACRHPGNRGPSRKIAEAIARVVQDAIAQESPEAGRLLERGWHQVYDVPMEGR